MQRQARGTTMTNVVVVVWKGFSLSTEEMRRQTDAPYRPIPQLFETS